MPGSMEEIWAAHAAAYNGKKLFWIEQSVDTQIKAANSGGVCFALTQSWVKATRRGKPAAMAYFKEFIDARRPDPTHRVPASYIEKQVYWREINDIKNQALAIVKELLATATDRTSPTKSELTAEKKRLQNYKYRMPVLATENFPIKGNDLGLVMLSMEVDAENPCCLMLSFVRKGGGHVVGFRCTPDIDHENKFYFFDANLGMFAFKTFEDMSNFFEHQVWPDIYGAKGYGLMQVVQVAATEET